MAKRFTGTGAATRDEARQLAGFHSVLLGYPVQSVPFGLGVHATVDPTPPDPVLGEQKPGWTTFRWRVRSPATNTYEYWEVDDLIALRDTELLLPANQRRLTGAQFGQLNALLASGKVVDV